MNLIEDLENYIDRIVDEESTDPDDVTLLIAVLRELEEMENDA